MKIPKTDYSQISKYYDKVRTAKINTWIFKIIEFGAVNENSCVLDVGGGTGRFPLAISSLTKATMFSIDLSKEMLKKAVKKAGAEKIFWVQADGHRLPFKGKYFDCVYMTLVLHHLDDKATALHEVLRVLKKNGKCVIMTQSHSKIRKNIISNFPKISSIDLNRFPSIPSAIEMMAKIGFKEVHTRRIERDEGPIPVEEYLGYVRNKYISTLTLLTKEEFQKGIAIFEKNLKQKYGNQIHRVSGFNFIVGQRGGGNKL